LYWIGECACVAGAWAQAGTQVSRIRIDDGKIRI
jgi:hypothetical protein